VIAILKNIIFLPKVYSTPKKKVDSRTNFELSYYQNLIGDTNSLNPIYYALRFIFKNNSWVKGSIRSCEFLRIFTNTDDGLF